MRCGSLRVSLDRCKTSVLCDTAFLQMLDMNVENVHLVSVEMGRLVTAMSSVWMNPVTQVNYAFHLYFYAPHLGVLLQSESNLHPRARLLTGF